MTSDLERHDTVDGVVRTLSEYRREVAGILASDHCDPRHPEMAVWISANAPGLFSSFIKEGWERGVPPSAISNVIAFTICQEAGKNPTARLMARFLAFLPLHPVH